MKMNVIIVGCGRVGSELAYRLYQDGNDVTVIDQNTASFNNLDPQFRGRTVEGDVLNQDVLRRAGIEKADALVAVTNSDSFNAVVAHIARVIYQVPNVIVRNYDPRMRPLHQAFSLPMVSSSAWGAQRLAEMICDDPMRVLFSPGDGEVEIDEIVAPESWHGRRLGDILPAEETIPVSLTRCGRAMLPSLDMLVEKGDVIHLSATPVGSAALRQQLKLSQGKREKKAKKGGEA